MADEEKSFRLKYDGIVKVEERDGQKLLQAQVPKGMQGHTFAIDARRADEQSQVVGPFKLEFVLGSDFLVYEQDLSSSNPLSGFSHLTIEKGLAALQMVLYAIDGAEKHELTVRLKAQDGVVKALIVDANFAELARAVRITSILVADLLDALCLKLAIPLAVHRINVTDAAETFVRYYATLPYGKRALTKDLLLESASTPRRMRAAVRLFREAVGSARPPYRLLCLYRIREVVEKIRAVNDSEILASGQVPSRPRRTLEANELTDFYFKDFVGKKVATFLDHIRDKFRLSVAHGNLDGFFGLVLDPSDIRIDHKIDYTNAVLMPVVATLVTDEIDLMTRQLPRVSRP